MIQLRSNRPTGVVASLALQDSTVRVRKQTQRDQPLCRTNRQWNLPNPFTVRVERILQRSVWTYVAVVVAITIVRNVAK